MRDGKREGERKERYIKYKIYNKLSEDNLEENDTYRVEDLERKREEDKKMKYILKGNGGVWVERGGEREREGEIEGERYIYKY